MGSMAACWLLPQARAPRTLSIGVPRSKAAPTDSQTVRLGVLEAGLMTRKYLWQGMAPSLAKAQIILQATAD